MDILTIKGAKAEDIAIHDGSGLKDSKPCLVMFNRKTWICFAAAAELELK